MGRHYDVIIVGGRVAGSSLAMRLDQQGLNVLLIDRATFPSWPSVPSSPAAHLGTLELLDELGLDEKEYTYPGGKASHMVLDVAGQYQVKLPFSRLGKSRDYVYGIDRNKFDTVMWQRAACLPHVTGWTDFAMTDVVRDETGRVTGIVGQSGQRTKEIIHGDLVVGADGRFSLAARKFGSKPFEEMNDYPGASYHAEWENMGDFSPEIPHPIAVYQRGGGYIIMTIPIDEGKYIVGNFLRTGETSENGRKPEEHYLETVQTTPGLRERLQNARRTSPVVGIRRIDNGYRQAYGDGWALAGDAFHYESPIDGQGIYNALLATKFLAEAIAEWKQDRPWLEAGAAYQQRFYDTTYVMLQQTVKRSQQELYSTPPSFVVNPLMRWMLSDPAYQKKFLGYLCRTIDPSTFSFGPAPGPILRGLVRDILRR